MPAERASMDEPRILDRYRLIERLAAGGSAEVWRAHDEQLDRPVAVKRLHPHLLPDRASRRRLVAEARAAAGLTHPVVVDVYDVDVKGEAPALVMELVEGESLAARIARDGPLPPTEAVRLVADLAEALFHAHQQGLIHRDVKPGNVLLARDGRVRLVDFGIARSLAASSERLTQTGTVVGTLGSMAPEQLAAGPITPRTDLYGLGVVLYESLAGWPPYPATTPLVLAEAQRAGPPPLEKLDPALAGIAAACLAYDPDDRPLHAGALAEALRGWLAGDVTTAMAAAAVPDASGAAAAPAAGPAEAPTITAPVAAPVPAAPVAAAASPPTAGHRRNRAPVLALALAGALGLLVLWLMLAGPGDMGDVVADASPTPTATTATPEPSPVPRWARELAAEVQEACDEVPADLAEELAAMGEDEAEDRAEALIDECEELADDGGNGGPGQGRGGRGNNGNGGNGNSGRGGGD
jgi:tRNA A-37 threonylcarbamoyl transferase component Bud32